MKRCKAFCMSTHKPIGVKIRGEELGCAESPTAEEDYKEMMKTGARWRERNRGSGAEEARRLRRSLNPACQEGGCLGGGRGKEDWSGPTGSLWSHDWLVDRKHWLDGERTRQKRSRWRGSYFRLKSQTLPKMTWTGRVCTLRGRHAE